jgi:hypothetical protein
MTEHCKKVEALDPITMGNLRLPLVRAKSVQARRVLQDEGCAFCRAVPTAGLDVLFLFDQSPNVPMVTLFQHLLRMVCATGRKVDRAALMQGQIVLDVDGVSVGFGPDRLPERRSGVYFRPKGTRRPHHAARLGHILQRHQASLRLRVGIGASDALLQELAPHIFMANAPKAVVLIGSRLVLSWTEFLCSEPSQLDQLSPGAILPRPVARYTRPLAPDGAMKRRLVDRRTPLLPPNTHSGYSSAMVEHRLLQTALRGASGPVAPVRQVRRLAALTIAALSGVVLVWG